VLLPWVALQPSRRERRWRRTGSAIAAVAALALAVAAARSWFNASLLLLTIGAAIAAWSAGRPRAASPAEIGIDDEGTVLLRSAAGSRSGGVRLQCQFAAPWLITFRQGTMLVSVWPDSLPEAEFRRLWVHVRWSGVPARDDRRPEADHVDLR